MSKWIVEDVSFDSMDLISGVSLLDVCNAAGWSSPHTFVRFYDLDFSTPGARLVKYIT